ncbi:MAG TPA: acVLRF1 family peptidyl-tRNA hydrolase [Pseudonocardiaceae bacterium]|nr:acVLRF1 family peptidyl-tRNA hydrolase [Pseudonocardiaceae bacterium]
MVEPSRVAGWFERFAGAHGGARRTTVEPRRVTVHAVDGATASVDVPFEPLAGEPAEHEGVQVDELVAHLDRPRRVALLLVRLGGYSVGVALGDRIQLSSTDRRLVHARHRAGGSSANRFRRRRDGQARVALQAAADAAARVLLPELPEVDAVVLGGDRQALAQLREDRRLAPLFERAEPAVLDVPEPRYAVLEEAAKRARCARIVVTDPA